MNYYTEGFKRMKDFSGRSTRKEYWIFFLINVLICLVLGILSVVIIAAEVTTSLTQPPILGLIIFFSLFIYMFVLILPSISITVRRLHDAGLSNRWLIAIYLLSLVGIISNNANVADWWHIFSIAPYIGSLILVVLTLLPSKPTNNINGTNQDDQVYDTNIAKEN